MIAPRIDGELVFCGRPGCPELLGRLTFPKRWGLRGDGWHYDRSAKPARWRRAERMRGKAKAQVRDYYAPWLPAGEGGYAIGRRAVIECPRCEAVQRIEG